MPFGKRRERREIDDLEQRIGRRFYPDHARVRTDGRFHRGEIAEIDETEIKPRRTPAHFIEQAERSAVDIFCSNDVIAHR